MLLEIQVSDEIRKFIQEIVLKYELGTISDVKYYSGAKKGDGFVSNSLAVHINGSKPLKLFVKYPLNMDTSDRMPVNRMYLNEIYFYNVIQPEYSRFLQEHNAGDLFKSTPKCYGTSTTALYTIALENLRDRSFELFERTKMMDETHTALVLKMLARFHAISFAYKNQHKEKYDELVSIIKDYHSDVGKKNSPFYIAVKTYIDIFLSKLYTDKEEYIIEKCNPETMPDIIFDITKSLDEHSIILQGDSWCNNIMFSYETADKRTPIDVMLIDWQLMKLGSPVYDVSFFLYTTAPGEASSRLADYLKLYHDELSRAIRRLGSDPDVIYPYVVLEEEWKKYGRYGFVMSFAVMKLMLTDDDETLDFENIDFQNMEENIQDILPTLKREDEYFARLKMIAEHLIKNNLL